MKARPSVPQLALQFTTRLCAIVSAQDLACLRKENEAERDTRVCHSHDYCDANDVMSSALADYGIAYVMEPAEGEPDDSGLWNHAWDYAKQARFDVASGLFAGYVAFPLLTEEQAKAACLSESVVLPSGVQPQNVEVDTAAENADESVLLINGQRVKLRDWPRGRVAFGTPVFSEQIRRNIEFAAWLGENVVSSDDSDYKPLDYADERAVPVKRLFVAPGEADLLPETNAAFDRLIAAIHGSEPAFAANPKAAGYANVIAALGRVDDALNALAKILPLATKLERIPLNEVVLDLHRVRDKLHLVLAAIEDSAS